MTFEEFWKVLSFGGTTDRDDVYHVEGEQLFIKSPSNRNPKYRIDRQQVQRYFHLLYVVKMREMQFKRGHSIYFYSVYEHVMSNPG